MTSAVSQPNSGTRDRLVSALERHGIVWAAVVACALRVVFTTVLFDWSDAPTSGDGATYVRFARGMLETGELESHHFPVGFPFLLAAFLKVADGGAMVAVRILQIALSTWTVVVIARIAAALYDRRAGLIAAWITALYPPLVFMSGRIMSETVFIFLLVLSLAWFVETERNATIAAHAVAGALFAVAALVRSNLIPMLPFLGIWLLVRPRQSLKTRLTTTATTTIVIGAILVLPGLYFLVEKGEFIPSATNAGQTFYGANNPLANGGWVQVEDHPELLSSIPPEVKRSEQAYSRAQFELGFRWIRENPADFVRLLPRKFGNAWVPGFQSSETTAGSPLAAFVLIAVSIPLLLAAIVGRALVKPALRDGLLLGVLVTYTLMSLAFYGNPRIGVFCAPILIVYAASLSAFKRRSANALPS